MPFMPGIDQSMTTTSGASVSIGEKQASAELASPTTTTSGENSEQRPHHAANDGAVVNDEDLHDRRPLDELAAATRNQNDRSGTVALLRAVARGAGGVAATLLPARERVRQPGSQRTYG